jgi:hypothetical protein
MRRKLFNVTEYAAEERVLKFMDDMMQGQTVERHGSNLIGRMEL